MLRKLKKMVNAMVLGIGLTMMADFSWADSTIYEIEELISDEQVVILAVPLLHHFLEEDLNLMCVLLSDGMITSCSGELMQDL